MFNVTTQGIPMNDQQAKLEWITARLTEGRTVYLTTHLRSTKLQAKHLPLIKLGCDGALIVRLGKRWVDYSYAKITAV